jgi:hypothetical protein
MSPAWSDPCAISLVLTARKSPSSKSHALLVSMVNGPCLHSANNVVQLKCLTSTPTADHPCFTPRPPHLRQPQSWHSSCDIQERYSYYKVKVSVSDSLAVSLAVPPLTTAVAIHRHPSPSQYRRPYPPLHAPHAPSDKSPDIT